MDGNELDNVVAGNSGCAVVTSAPAGDAEAETVVTLDGGKLQGASGETELPIFVDQKDQNAASLGAKETEGDTSGATKDTEAGIAAPQPVSDEPLPDKTLRAWLAVFACFSAHVFGIGYAASWGVFQRTLLLDSEFTGLTNFNLSYAGTILFGTALFTGIFVGALADRFPIPLLMLIGTTIMCGALIANSFARELWNLYVGFHEPARWLLVAHAPTVFASLVRNRSFNGDDADNRSCSDMVSMNVVEKKLFSHVFWDFQVREASSSCNGHFCQRYRDWGIHHNRGLASLHFGFGVASGYARTCGNLFRLALHRRLCRQTKDRGRSAERTVDHLCLLPERSVHPHLLLRPCSHVKLLHTANLHPADAPRWWLQRRNGSCHRLGVLGNGCARTYHWRVLGGSSWGAEYVCGGVCGSFVCYPCDMDAGADKSGNDGRRFSSLGGVLRSTAGYDARDFGSGIWGRAIRRRHRCPLSLVWTGRDCGTELVRAHH